MKYQFTRKSSNAKTGPIPTTMTERDTCPFRLNGCYAENFPLSLHWNKVSDTGVSSQDLADKLAELPMGQLWRHNVAGDLPTLNGTIDTLEMMPILRAVKNRQLKTILYTHHAFTRNNVARLQIMREHGVNVNASCESIEQANHALDNGINSVMVTPIGSPRREKIGSTTLVACPAQYRDNVTCASCGLCAHDRVASRVVVTFEAHGARKGATMRAIS